jgi:4-amino-4-deoxy-L-arabinose transferase-like glycosyltransferase
MATFSLEAKTTASPKSTWLGKRLILGVTPAGLFLAVIILISLFFHFYNIGAIGDANTYYTAGVKSMLQSWKNFFYAAAEPGGSVTLDKPPLGFWIEAAFAAVLGVNGLAVSLPNIISGILSIPLLYHLVKKQLGALAGLVAALVLAVTPVVVSTDRNNTIDGMLVFTLLLAAWTYIRAVESGKARYLFLGSFLVGLGFNIKMLEAFLPLPAFYGFYLLASKTGLWRKLINLAVAASILLVVSFSWALIVDLTPPDQRPYVGSSPDNSEMTLIFGYNGLSRLLGNARGLFDRQSGRPAGGGTNRAFTPPGRAGFPGGALGGSGGVMFANETGQPGIFRLFQPPLANEMSWMLPFALFSLLLLAFSGRLRFPLENRSHQVLVLWGGWLLTCVVFFSMAHFFHSYYMIMLAPALGAVVAGGFARLWSARKWAGWLLVAGALVTTLYQLFLAQVYGVEGAWLLLPLLLFLASAGLVAWGSLQDEPETGLDEPKTGLDEPDTGLPDAGPWSTAAVPSMEEQTENNARPESRAIRRFQQAAQVCLLAAMLVVPFAWTMQTVTLDNPDVNLPAAYGGNARGGPARAGFGPAGFPGGGVNRANFGGNFGGPSTANKAMLDFLQANTQGMEYLVAVQSANQGAPLVLASGRPVLYMGGFSGSDPVIDAQGLAQLVAAGRLRYVLSGRGMGGGNASIGNWVTSNCTPVQFASQDNAPLQQFRGGGFGDALYDCAP